MRIGRGVVVVALCGLVLPGCGEAPVEPDAGGPAPTTGLSGSLPPTAPSSTEVSTTATTRSTASTTESSIGRELRPLGLADELGIDNVLAIATNTSGDAAFGTDDGVIVVVPSDGRTEPDSIDVDGVSVNDVAFDEDGRLLAACGDGAVRAWRHGESGWTSAWPAPETTHLAAATALVVDPEQRWVASSGDDERLRRWSLTDGAEIGDAIDLDNPTSDLAVTPGGTVIATTSSGRLLSVDVDNGSKRIVPAGADAIAAIAIDAVGHLWTAGGQRASVVDFGAGSGSGSGTASAADSYLGGTFSDGATAIAVWNRADGAGQVIAVGGLDGGLGSVLAWDPSAAESAVELGGTEGPPTAIAFSADGATVFFADYRNAYRLALANR